MTDVRRETVALRKTDARLASAAGAPAGTQAGRTPENPAAPLNRACPEGGAACACTDIQPAGDARRAAQRRGDTNNRRNRQKSRLVHRFLPEKRLRAETRTAKAQFAKNRDAIRARKTHAQDAIRAASRRSRCQAGTGMSRVGPPVQGPTSSQNPDDAESAPGRASSSPVRKEPDQNQ